LYNKTDKDCIFCATDSALLKQPRHKQREAINQTSIHISGEMTYNTGHKLKNQEQMPLWGSVIGLVLFIHI
jgi:hypothetical protein